MLEGKSDFAGRMGACFSQFLSDAAQWLDVSMNLSLCSIILNLYSVVLHFASSSLCYRFYSNLQDGIMKLEKNICLDFSFLTKERFWKLQFIKVIGHGDGYLFRLIL